MSVTNGIISIIIITFFTSCVKKTYIPSSVEGKVYLTGRLSSDMSISKVGGATYKDGTVIFNQGRFILKNKSLMLNSVDKNLLFLTDDRGSLVIEDINNSTNQSFYFGKKIASVSKKENYLALLYIDNSIEVYDTTKKRAIFSLKNDSAKTSDAKVASPKFLQDLVIFPTLDGKIMVISIKDREVVRSIIVSSKEFFNNISFLDIVDDTLIASTGYDMYIFEEMEYRRSYPIRDVRIIDDKIYITTKYGELIELDFTLKEIKKVKFEFATLLGFIKKGDNFYLIEDGGYLIVVDKDFKNKKVFNIQLDEGYLFATGDTFYFDNVYYKVP